MSGHGIIAIGASAGGMEALIQLVGTLPADLPAAVFVVWHLSPDSPGILPEILNRNGRLEARNATDWDRVRPRHIYVAPPDHHLLVENGHVRLSRGPRENRFRPAVDVLFRSAAQAYGSKVIGVVLSGSLDDGTAGLYAIKHRGGIAIVQDPDEAPFPSMPLSALEHVDVDYTVKLAVMGPLLARLVQAPVRDEGVYPVSDEMEIEVRVAMDENAFTAGVEQLGQLSAFTCPECHGTLRQLTEGDRIRFRCHTGHAFSPSSLLAAATDSIEESLWNSIRALEEAMRLLHHLGQHLEEAGEQEMAGLFSHKAAEFQRRADLVRKAVLDHEHLGDNEELETAGQL